MMANDAAAGCLGGLFFCMLGGFTGAAIAAMLFGSSPLVIIAGIVVGILILPGGFIALAWWQDSRHGSGHNH